ncbi:MAG TPA: hypothetical protein VGA37_14270 [Gemmatimonadales bacterium]
MAATAAVLFAAVAASAAVVRGSQSFPTTPLDAELVSGGGVGAGGSPTTVFLNPANAVMDPAVEFSFSVQDVTGLRGKSLLVGFQAGVHGTFAFWRYDVADLFDEELIAADPGLGALTVGVTGVGAALGVPIGRWRIGAVWSVQMLDNLGGRSEEAAMAVGMKHDADTWAAGIVAARTLFTFDDAGPAGNLVRAGLQVTPLRRLARAILAADLSWSRRNGLEAADTWIVVPVGVASFRFGRRWMTGQVTTGVQVAVRGITLQIAQEFAGRKSVGNLRIVSAVLEL